MMPMRIYRTRTSTCSAIHLHLGSAKLLKAAARVAIVPSQVHKKRRGKIGIVELYTLRRKELWVLLCIIFNLFPFNLSSTSLALHIEHNHTQQIMALPSKQEFEALLSSLNNVAKDYSDANDLDSHLRRIEISGQAKKLVRALTTPEQMPIQHGINVGHVQEVLVLFQSSPLLTRFHPIDGRNNVHPHLYEARHPGSDTKDRLDLTRGLGKSHKSTGLILG